MASKRTTGCYYWSLIIICAPALRTASNGTSGMSLFSCEPQFPHWQNDRGWSRIPASTQARKKVEIGAQEIPQQAAFSRLGLSVPISRARR